MKVHEYQAKEILRRYGVPTPRGVVVTTPDEARQAAKDLGGRVVVKAQIHAGGRGKGGGVKLAKDADEAAGITKMMIGMKLVTHQTGPEGRQVRKVLIEEALNIDRELYLGITLDRRIGMPVVMASKQGGMEIEEVAARDPKAIHREPVDGVLGVQPFQARSVANALGLSGGASAEQVANAFRIILSDKNVKAILINIFGGIMRGDRIAEGVVGASREIGLPVPVVVRLEGTNVDLGKKILAESGLPLITA